jgi:hypothetical protein
MVPKIKHARANTAPVQNKKPFQYYMKGLSCKALLGLVF